MSCSEVTINEVELISTPDPAPSPRRTRGSICVIGNGPPQYFIVTRTRVYHTYTDRWQLTALDDGNNWSDSRDRLEDIIDQADNAMVNYGGRWLREGEVLQILAKECEA